MPFVRAPDGKGLFYVPEAEAERPKKHPCPDCTFCLMCNDHRCATCLDQKGACGRRGCPSKTAEQDQ
jgi:hypothetical protein